MAGYRRLIGLLAVLQALLLTNNVITFLLAGPIGYALAPDQALATAPITSFVVGAAVTTLPMSLLMKRKGRRFGFMLGALIGFAGAVLCVVAVIEESFPLFMLGTLCAGAYSASGQYLRFAVAEAVDDKRRSRAISYVLLGGIGGAFLGPESAALTRSAFASPYLGPYVSLMFFSVVSFVLPLFLRFPNPPVPAGRDHELPPQRSLAEIAAQPGLGAAVLGAIIAYAVMNFLMTSTSLAMLMHNHSNDDAAFVVEWHIVAMFAPALFTGNLIQRFGNLKVMSWGAYLLIATAILAASGTSFMQFWGALFLLGIGWNFLYVGATTLLTNCYRSSERGKVQGLNDTLIFVGTGTSSLLSGTLLHFAGWQVMVLSTLPLSLLALAVLHWTKTRSTAAALVVEGGT